MKTRALFAAAVVMSAASFAASPAEDWSRIYLGSDPSVAPDGSFFVFSWSVFELVNVSLSSKDATPLHSNCLRPVPMLLGI